jgi:hypothetical protein
MLALSLLEVRYGSVFQVCAVYCVGCNLCVRILYLKYTFIGFMVDMGSYNVHVLYPCVK